MINKVNYELAKASGTLELLRSDEISRLVRKRYTLGAELRITINYSKDSTNPKHIAELEEHEAYVEECKAIVDAEMQKMAEEIEAMEASR